MTRICMTEWYGYGDSSESDYRSRFDCYEELGVETLRLHVGSFDKPNLVNALKDTPFRIKVILYVTYITHHYKEPARMQDHLGGRAKTLGPWNPKFAEATRAAGERGLKAVVESGMADRVDEVVVDLGPAAEPMYPANWTLGRSGNNQGFWCYSMEAQNSFRNAMFSKYKTINAANRAWRLRGDKRFKTNMDIQIPAPGMDWAKGQFWDDMLTWYRDSKRQMVLSRINQTQEMVREFLGPGVKCIVYLPGHAYTQRDWKNAVENASGNSAIRLMMDNDWLMETAIKHDCILQYTGVENSEEVGNIVRKLKKMRSDAYKTMWGENAGLERVGLHPMHLADVITKYELRGIDFTWGTWLFDEKDRVTPTETFEEFRQAVEKIRNKF